MTAARWQDQCFLTDARHYLSGENKKITRGYKNMIAIEETSSDAIKTFASLPNSNLFFKLNPAQMALLVPTIRFWVVHYKHQSKNDREYHKFSSAQELYLDDYTSPTQVSAIEKAIEGQTRAYGIGLKKFTYEFDGGDFATTEKSIKVRAEFLLTSFDSLLKKQGTGGKKARWLDILLRTPKKIPKSLQEDAREGNLDEKDILTACREPAINRDAARADEFLVSNPAYKRIKARIGWAATDVDALVDLFDSDVTGTPTASKMRNMLESLQLDLFLEMTNYDFNFENDGRTTLTVDYRASVEGSLREPSANLFYGLQEQIRNKTAARDEKIAQLEVQKAEYQEQAGTRLGSEREVDDGTVDPAATSDTVSQSLALLDKKITDVNNEYSDIIEVWKYQHYRIFLNKMLKEGKIRSIRLKKEDLLEWRGFPGTTGRNEGIRLGEREKTIQEYAEARKKQNIKKGKAAAILKKRLTSYGSTNITNNLDENEKQYTSLACEIDSMRQDINALVARARIRGSMRETPQDEINVSPGRCAEYPNSSGTNLNDHIINFLYLGDIIDTIMSIHKQNLTMAGVPVNEQNLRIVTTDILDFNPLNNKEQALNIADIPISLEEFSSFFRRKVVNPRVSQYFIMDFIKDLMSELVYRALGGACWAAQNAVVPSFTYTLYQAKRENPSSEPWLKRFQGFFPRRPLTRKDRKNYKSLGPNDVGPDKIMNYFILHGSLRTTAKRKVDYKKDVKDGIYHFGLGLRRGILKEVKFISNKMVHANTARVLADGAAGIDQLFNKFDANVELYGCPLFRNGQYIYIDPRTMGVKSDISRALGLGGYYNIYNVKSHLSREGYKTTLKCKFNSSGLCDDKRVVKEDAIQPLAPPQTPPSIVDDSVMDGEAGMTAEQRDFLSQVNIAAQTTGAGLRGPSNVLANTPEFPSAEEITREELVAAKAKYSVGLRKYKQEETSRVYEKYGYNDALLAWKAEEADYNALRTAGQDPGYQLPPPPTPPTQDVEHALSLRAFNESGMPELMAKAKEEAGDQ